MMRWSLVFLAAAVAAICVTTFAQVPSGAQSQTRPMGGTAVSPGLQQRKVTTSNPVFGLCGGQGQACCVDKGNPLHYCGVGLGCDMASNRCVSPCGSIGQACCVGPETFAPTGNKCPTGAVITSDGSCLPRKQLCEGGACDPGSQRCFACGEKEGDACCPPDAQQATASCGRFTPESQVSRLERMVKIPQPKLYCQSSNLFKPGGTCVSCGSLNIPPCPDGSCKEGLGELGGYCVPCGHIEQPSCNGRCLEGGDIGGVCSTHYKRPVPAARKCSYAPGGLIAREWMRLGGPNGPMGCPISYDDTYVQFENGAISTSPDKWPKGVWGAYQDGDHFLIDWTTAFYDEDAKNYDKFLLHWEDDRGTSLGLDLLQKIEDLPVNADAHVATVGALDVIKYEACTDGGCTHDTHLRKNGIYTDKFPSLHPEQYKNGDVIHHKLLIEGCDFRTLSSPKCDGWLRPLAVDFKWPPPDIGMFNWGDFSHIKPATTVEESKNRFEDRFAALVFKRACQPLPPTFYHHEEDAEVLIAKLAYANYFQSDYCPGKDISNREEANAWIMKQSPQSRTGTTVDDHVPFRSGEYDVALSGLMPVYFKLGQGLTQQSKDHILNVLLNTRGPLDTSELKVFGISPETENHINMTQSARYLTNQLLFDRTRIAQYDNRANGLADWWLGRLRDFLRRDFIEYNSRPYTGYSLAALQNLYSYAEDTRVQNATKMVLDYLSAKIAVSSINGRRSVPYRRRASHYDDDFSVSPDPNMLRSFILAGNTEMLGDISTQFDQGPCGSGGNPIPCDINFFWHDAQGKAYLPWRWPAMKAPQHFLWEMTMAGVSNYRIPDPILDLIVNRDHRNFYQGFEHFSEEIYASSSSYLISGGGSPSPYAYVVDLGVKTMGDKEDIGQVPPTTFMPYGAYRTRDFMVRFNGEDDPSSSNRYNLCVAPDFACGTNTRIPVNYLDPKWYDSKWSYYNQGTPADKRACVERRGSWLFFNRSGPICGHFTYPPECLASSRRVGMLSKGAVQQQEASGVCRLPGYYLAISGGGDYGVLEAYDTYIPGHDLTFEEFKTQVPRNNPRPFSRTGTNSYLTIGGKRIQFVISPQSRVLSVTPGTSRPPQSTFLWGDIMNSGGYFGNGLITIRNPYTNEVGTMDDRQASNPVGPAWKQPFVPPADKARRSVTTRPFVPAPSTKRRSVTTPPPK